MGSIQTFAAINTKVKCLEGRMLKKEQYEKLLKCKNYKEVLKYLKEETHYSESLGMYNLEDIHRGQLEIILKKYYFNKFNKLSYYFNGYNKKLLKIFLMRIEIEDLKTILRGKYIEKEKEELYPLIICESSQSCDSQNCESSQKYERSLKYINFNELIEQKDIEDVVEKLKDTKYYKHISPLVSTVKEDGLFRMEMALDFVYLSSLRNIYKKMDKEDREVMEKLNGIYSDLLNIEWIYRGKKYYKLTAEELFSYTVYDSYRININMLKNLCYAKDLEKFYNILEKSQYNGIFKGVKNEQFSLKYEISTYFKKIYMKYKKENKLNISFVIVYLELMLLEIRDVISISESKIYNLDNEKILKYINI